MCCCSMLGLDQLPHTTLVSRLHKALTERCVLPILPLLPGVYAMIDDGELDWKVRRLGRSLLAAESRSCAVRMPGMRSKLAQPPSAACWLHGPAPRSQ